MFAVVFARQMQTCFGQWNKTQALQSVRCNSRFPMIVLRISLRAEPDHFDRLPRLDLREEKGIEGAQLVLTPSSPNPRLGLPRPTFLIVMGIELCISRIIPCYESDSEDIQGEIGAFGLKSALGTGKILIMSEWVHSPHSPPVVLPHLEVGLYYMKS